MPITIGSNIASLAAQRRLSEGTSQLSKTYERLSSGQRINKAADDAAGLAISESLKSDRRVFNQGIRNFNDGISLLNIADGAIENLSGIVIRLKELAEQSANGTYSNVQRAAIDKEAQALSKEYTRIAQSTKFNGVHLLNGSLGNGVRLQGGYGAEGSIFSGIGGAIGTGTFNTAISFQSSDQETMSVSLADLNGDGIQDMVGVGNEFASPVVYSWLGNGDGSFQSARTFQLPNIDPREVVLGDLNGDGALDVVAAGAGGGVGLVSVLLGDGNGTFGQSRSYLMESTNTESVSIGDLNNDGVMDLVSAGSNFLEGRITVRLGSGNGTFGIATSYLTGSTGNNSVRLGDLNNDGILDVVSAGDNGSGYIYARLGSGDGTFASEISYDMGVNFASEVSLADLNGDGVLDAITAGSGAAGIASIRLGNGNGTFGSSTSYTMAAGEISEISIGDLNGDGILDLAAAGSEFGASIVSARLGNGDGTFGSTTTIQMGNRLERDITMGDLNGDGVNDLIVAGYNYDIAHGQTSVLIGRTQDGVSALLEFNIQTAAGAKQALSLFDQKIQQLGKQRGQIGAFQSRVQVGINNLQTASENYAAAESRIKDADIAAESAQLVRLNILQQAAASVLGQANLQPQLALNLLRN